MKPPPLQARHKLLLLAWALLAAGLVLIHMLTPELSAADIALGGRPFPDTALAALDHLQTGSDYARWIEKYWRTADGGSFLGLGGARDGAGMSLGRLRWVLWADSALVVPAYVLLFVLFARQVFGPPAPAEVEEAPIDVPFHLLIAVQVFAALCDLVENGTTVLAAEDALAGLLATGTVHDVHLLTALKWFGFGAAWLALGLKAFSMHGARVADKRLGRVQSLAGAGAVVAGMLFIGYQLGYSAWLPLALGAWLASVAAFSYVDLAPWIDRLFGRGDSGGKPVPVKTEGG